ncbi:hypothetical protein P4C99_08685 [Pontiellaceae bacterium B1224]|nr:hypothetical protein [Pontiellaceae bacterium B1224]
MKYIMVLLCVAGLVNQVRARSSFDQETDLLLAQFDNKPDTDDIHAQAALGCMLVHPNFNGVNYLAVAGAYGDQPEKYTFIDSTSLMNLAFGEQNVGWTDAHNDWSGSVARIQDRAKSTLDAGGKVWVLEAGQSNITADWIAALIKDGVSEERIKSNVMVVQHSRWNEKSTNGGDLNYVKEKATYIKIEDGNKQNATPDYTSAESSYLIAASTSSNATAQSLWKEAAGIIDVATASYDNLKIVKGGVDYSDIVEGWWIFEDTDVTNVNDFWSKYVVNEPAAQ